MMQLLDKKAGCYGCGACQAVCSAEAIAMIPDAEGFLYPVINPARCVDCGRCSSVCPAKQPVEPLEGHGYAVRCNEPELLKKWYPQNDLHTLYAAEIVTVLKK